MNPTEIQKTKDIIRQYVLREVQKPSPINPEFTPADLANAFADHEAVKSYTNQDQTVWLLVSETKWKLRLPAPLVNSES